MADIPWWARESLWRKMAIWITAIMAVILIFLSFHSVALITAGSARVPAYSVINQRIDYRFDRERNRQQPVIGDPAPLFGRVLSEA
ncbi:MAG: cytochrome c, partial [Gammaproteobacteria bacterium]|nr:cytochrome c [Gammaproteobacteria bacterium]